MVVPAKGRADPFIAPLIFPCNPDIAHINLKPDPFAVLIGSSFDTQERNIVFYFASTFLPTTETSAPISVPLSAQLFADPAITSKSDIRV